MQHYDVHAIQRWACRLRSVEWTSGRPDRSKGILGDIILGCAGAIGGEALTLGAGGNGGFHLDLFTGKGAMHRHQRLHAYAGIKWTRASEGHTHTTICGASSWDLFASVDFGDPTDLED